MKSDSTRPKSASHSRFRARTAASATLLPGGKGEPHGFKWSGRDPDSVRHLCPHCGVLISQSEYLAVEASGVFINEDGTLWIDHETAAFTRPDGSPAPTPRHIGMHVWTAYSPVVSWSQIVREFFAALDKMDQGDDSKMKAWTNTTLGQTWEGKSSAPTRKSSSHAPSLSRCA